jgi:hypothetical protein
MVQCRNGWYFRRRTRMVQLTYPLLSLSRIECLDPQTHFQGGLTFSRSRIRTWITGPATNQRSFLSTLSPPNRRSQHPHPAQDIVARTRLTRALVPTHLRPSVLASGSCWNTSCVVLHSTSHIPRRCACARGRCP